jgi:hypothetical protein
MDYHKVHFLGGEDSLGPASLGPVVRQHVRDFFSDGRIARAERTDF